MLSTSRGTEPRRERDSGRPSSGSGTTGNSSLAPLVCQALLMFSLAYCAWRAWFGAPLTSTQRVPRPFPSYGWWLLSALGVFAGALGILGYWPIRCSGCLACGGLSSAQIRASPSDQLGRSKARTLRVRRAAAGPIFLRRSRALRARASNSRLALRVLEKPVAR
jgi:hypothetical protein